MFLLLTVFLHLYTSILWVNGSVGANSVFLCLIACFYLILLESKPIYTELQAREEEKKTLFEKWQKPSAQCHLVGELNPYQPKSFSVISL